jgi:tRNA(fMet)-specific endonuclease VapC
MTAGGSIRVAGRYLVDTNIVIAYFAGERPLLDRFETATEINASVVTLGELVYGAMKSSRPRENLIRLEQLRSAVALLRCDAETARRYGELKNELRRKGRPIPENDIWIAATALQHGLTLVTPDSDFEHVEGIDREIW